MSRTPLDAELDTAAGFKHVLFTWAVALLPVAGIVGGFLSSALDTAATRRPGPQTGGVFILLVQLFHWPFTVTAGVSAVWLTIRPVTAAKKWTTWIGFAVALLCSLYLAGSTRW